MLQTRQELQTNESTEISNLDLPIATVIREALLSLTPASRIQIVTPTTEEEFIAFRVDIYLQELEAALRAGYDELGAKEMAMQECLREITAYDDEVF